MPLLSGDVADRSGNGGSPSWSDCARAAARIFRACSIFSAATFRSARVKRWCPAAREPLLDGAIWPALLPISGADFFDKLMSRDDGWLAGLYDALSRIHGPVQEYLTEPARMKRFYAAVRGKVTTPGPARPVFNSNADMMLLTTRLQLDREWQSSHSRRHRRLERPVLERLERKVRSEAQHRGPELERSRRRHRSAFRLVPQAGGERAAPDFHGADRYGSHSHRSRCSPPPWNGWRTTGMSTAPSTAFFSEVPTLTDQTIIAWLDSCGSARQIARSGFPPGCHRNVPGADRTVADFLPAREHSAGKADAALTGLLTSLRRAEN